MDSPQGLFFFIRIFTYLIIEILINFERRKTMRFREIRTSEKLTEKDEKDYGYLKIKPEGELANMSVEEARKICEDFWKAEFARIAENN